MTNEEIVKRLIDSKAVDFAAIGRLVGELGPGLATSTAGAKLTLVGSRFNIILVCIPPAEASQLVGEIVRGELAQAVAQE
ncbi:MAG: hypothetical protein JO282_06225 [Alphaproteobacteria bacterium]|nr:hypothetical protein [Alphaproteobacteria bacterium]